MDRHSCCRRSAHLASVQLDQPGVTVLASVAASLLCGLQGSIESAFGTLDRERKQELICSLSTLSWLANCSFRVKFKEYRRK